MSFNNKDNKDEFLQKKKWKTTTIFHEIQWKTKTTSPKYSAKQKRIPLIILENKDDFKKKSLRTKNKDDFPEIFLNMKNKNKYSAN